jgi:hypothetical protein
MCRAAFVHSRTVLTRVRICRPFDKCFPSSSKNTSCFGNVLGIRPAKLARIDLKRAEGLLGEYRFARRLAAQADVQRGPAMAAYLSGSTSSAAP